MKTYFLDVIKRIKRFSEKFNVSTTLCDKTWIVFNDTDEREVYIFQPDGSVFITSDGVGIKGKWHWVSANESLIINKDDNVLMFHPEFIDNTILALTLDGTNKMAFLIEQGNQNAFAAKNLSQLEKYFEIKEQELIQAENDRIERERLQAIEDERRRKDEEEKRRIAEEERRKKEEAKRHEEWLKENESRLKKEAKKISNHLRPLWFKVLQWIFGILIYIAIFAEIYFVEESLPIPVTLNNLVGFIIVAIILTAVLFIVNAMVLHYIMITPFLKKAKKQFEENFSEWRNNNPNDDRTPYISFE